MRLPSYRYTALADLTDDELRALLAEDETLFGEHKAGLGQDEAFQLVKAMASFANGFGGWVLLGVKDCEPSGWKPPSGPLVDSVRQRLEGRIDPLPPFAAATREVDGKTIGVVRVYESSDTPHVVTQNGGIYVREVAQDKEHGKRAYRPQGVASHHVLRQLAQRGEVAAERAEGRFAPYVCPFLDDVLELRYDLDPKQRLIHVPQEPAVVVRMASLTVTPRFAEWTVSEEAQDACVDVASALTGGGKVYNDPDRLRVHAQGLAVIAGRGDSPPMTDSIPRPRRATVAVDAAGVVGARLAFAAPGEEDAPEVTPNGLRDRLLQPALAGLAALLQTHEFLGRASCHLDLMRASELVYLTHNGRRTKFAAHVPAGGDITVPTLATLESLDQIDVDEESDVHALSDRWARAVARAGGLVIFG